MPSLVSSSIPITTPLPLPSSPKHLYVTRIQEVEAYTLDQLFSDIGKQFCSATMTIFEATKIFMHTNC